MLEHGCGALNIDGCRLQAADAPAGRTRHGGGIVGAGSSYELPDSHGEMPAGRWPANLILDAEAGAMVDEQAQDLSIANSVIDRIESRLQFAFLLNTAIQRPGERVTAEEIRFMSQELEAGIGGLYSILTQELQLPMVRRLMFVLKKQGKIPSLPKTSGGKDPITAKAVTGLEAIGRGDDRNKLIEFITTASQVLGPEVLERYINIDEALRRLANSVSIDTTDLVRTKEELDAAAQAAAEQQQQMQQMEMTKQGLASPALGQLAKNFTQPGAPYGPQFDEQGIPSGLPSPTGGPVEDGGDAIPQQPLGADEGGASPS